MIRTKNISKNNIKLFRSYHRIMAIWFLIFIVFMALTGITLGWKKHSGNLLLPKTMEGSTTDLAQWLSLDSLNAIALNTLNQPASNSQSPLVSRIDARPDKGMVKFVFEKHNTEIQLDAATGNVLFVGKRWSDVVERLHDGSIVDRWLGISGGYFKLIYSTLLGVSLIALSVSGFFIWSRTRSKIIKQ